LPENAARGRNGWHLWSKAKRKRGRWRRSAEARLPGPVVLIIEPPQLQVFALELARVFRLDDSLRAVPLVGHVDVHPAAGCSLDNDKPFTFVERKFFAAIDIFHLHLANSAWAGEDRAKVAVEPATEVIIRHHRRLKTDRHGAARFFHRVERIASPLRGT